MLARDAMLYRELAQMEFMWAKGWMTTLAFKYENGCNRYVLQPGFDLNRIEAFRQLWALIRIVMQSGHGTA